LSVDFQDLRASDSIGPIDEHLPIEATGAKQCGIENLRTVACCEKNQAATGIKAVHLDQKLVQRLLLFVMTAERICAAGASQRVQLIDEDDRRRALAGLLEKVAHARCANADEHLDEFGSIDRKERHAGFAGDGAGEKRLAGSGRSDQQHALGNSSAQPLEASRVLEKSDHLAELLLRFVDACDVGERRLGIRFDVDLGAALADGEQYAHAALL